MYNVGHNSKEQKFRYFQMFIGDIFSTYVIFTKVIHMKTCTAEDVPMDWGFTSYMCTSALAMKF